MECHSNEERVAKLLATLDRFSTVMMIGETVEGTLEIRPMRIAQREKDGVLWFATSVQSPQVAGIEVEHLVHLTAQSDDGEYLAIRGLATIHRSPTAIERLWSESMKVWFPAGKADPELAFIRVKIEEGEYWDNSGLNKLRYAFNALRSYVTHEKMPPSRDDQHGCAEVYHPQSRRTLADEGATNQHLEAKPRT